MAVYKNKASQKVAVFAVDADGAAKTGDAANISAQISLDGGATAATNDAAPTELDATDAPGIYLFDLTQAETNADLIVIAPVSGTAGVILRPVVIYTEPEQRIVASVTGAVGSVTGNVGGNVTGTVAGVTPAAVGAAMTLANGSITAAVIATDAIDADSIKADAITEIQSGLALEATLTAIKGAGWSDETLKSIVDLIEALNNYAGGDTPGVTTLLSRVVGTILAGNHTAQSGDSYARLGAPSGASVSADVLAVKNETSNIVADTNELQLELVDGGRTDLILDAIKAKTDNLPASPAATGAEMTLTAAYDEAKEASPTVDAIADAVWDELIADHAVVGSTGESLAASGSSGDPWSTSLPGAYGAGTAGKIVGDNLDAKISGVGGAVGPGATSTVLTLLESDEITPIADAQVWISTDSAGSNVVAGPVNTNSIGKVTFLLDSGVTYYRWAQKDGTNFSNPQSFTA